MEVVVAVISHKHHHILPRTGILVLGVGDRLVNQDLSLFGRANGETSDGDVVFVTTCGVTAFTIVQTAEESVVHIAVGTAEGVFAFIAKQEVVGRVIRPGRRVHAVVPGTIAKEQKVFRHQGRVVPCPVVKHLHVAPVGIGIGRTAGELIVEFVGRNNPYTQTVVLLMESLQTLGLRLQFLGSGYDDDHIHGLIGMMVLIGDVIDILRNRDVGRRKLRRREGRGKL